MPTMTTGSPEGRCERCGWPLYTSVEKGCVPGNCSMRPLPPIRTPYGTLTGRQAEALDDLARGETPPPAALQGLLFAAADLRHAAGAALSAPDDHRALLRLRAAVGAYDRARAAWGRARLGRSPDVS